MILSKNNGVVFVFLIHSVIIVALLLFFMITGRDYADYLLRDDGYYRVAGDFLKGQLCAPFGPGLPLIFTPIHMFPAFLHPVIRIIISQAAVLLIILFLRGITRDILSGRQFFFGSLMVVLHPAFLHWSFRTSIDLYLTMMLLGFVFFLVKYLQTNQIRNLIFLMLFYGFGIFTRPSFILIPFVILIAVLIIKRYNNMIKQAALLLVFSLIVFYINNLYIQNCRKGRIEITADTGRSVVIFHSFWLTQTILETKQFHKGTVDSYDVVDIDDKTQSGALMIMDKYMDDNLLKMIGNYAKENPDIFAAKFLLSPIFYFSLSSRQSESYLLLFVTIIYFFISMKGMRYLFRNVENRRYLLMFLLIAFGYAALHWLTHSYSRYSLPVIPLIFIWSGIVVEKLFRKTGEVKSIVISE